MTISKGKKALIHVAKTRLGLTDAEYLDILGTYGNGAQSSRDLNDRTFVAVLDHFKRLGFVPDTKFYRPAGSKTRLTAKISAICNELGLTEKYVNGMARNMFGIPTYRWLDAKQLHKLVAALSYHQKRKRAEAGR